MKFYGKIAVTKLLEDAGIYVLRCRPTEKCYIGKDSNLGIRAKQHLTLKCPKCRAIHAAIKKYGADAFDVELIPYPGISPEALGAVEKWKIAQLDSHRNGYNLTQGGDGVDPESAREENHKRIQDGTHNFLGSETNRKRVEDGTHPFLSGEIQRKTNHRRVLEGTNPFLGGKIQGETNRGRVKDGTHNLLGGKMQRKLVAEGRHHLLGGEIQRKSNHKRVKDGTHNFLKPENNRRAKYFQRLKNKERRRNLYQIYASLLYSRSVFEIYLYRKRCRNGFFDKGVPDTSQAGQLALF